MPDLEHDSAPLGKWQDIGTAPKDGTQFLAFIPSYYQGKGGISVVLRMNGLWFDSRAWPTTPSHWMPLPSPPSLNTTEGGAA